VLSAEKLQQGWSFSFLLLLMKLFLCFQTGFCSTMVLFKVSESGISTMYPSFAIRQYFTLPHGFRWNPADSEQSARIRWNMSFRWISTESEWNMLEFAGICRNMSFQRIPRAIPANSDIPADSTGHSSRFPGPFQGLSDALQIPAGFRSFLRIPVDSGGIKFC
jgi:hypothetical protein